MASLRPGGAERVMASLANHWAAAGHDVTLVTLASDAGDVFAVDPRIGRVPLGLMQESRSPIDGVWLNARRVSAVRRTVRSVCPDVVISFHAPLNVIALLACRGLRVPVIVSERVYPPSHRLPVQWEWLRRVTYRFAQAVVVQTAAARAWADRLVRRNRIHVIPNAVGRPFSDGLHPGASGRLPVVLGVGRLVRQKGFDVLIRAFASVAERHHDWTLTIVGEGPEAEELRALANALRPGAVRFAGHSPEPELLYRSAGLFVLPSRFEGFPNALLEAMASGCAVIATDCTAGPGEIVRNDLDGLLVRPDDKEGLARAMDGLMSDEGARLRLGKEAREVVNRFSPIHVMRLWDTVIDQVAR